jgi:hypothetical protein
MNINTAMGEDGGSMSHRGRHDEIGIDLMSFHFHDMNDAVTEDGDVQSSKSPDWLQMVELSGFMVDQDVHSRDVGNGDIDSGYVNGGDVDGGDVDGGHSIFRDYGEFSKADSYFINSSSPTNTEDDPPQTVFALEDYGNILEFDNQMPFQYVADIEFTEHTGVTELHMTTPLIDLSV